jgi:uncharacterized protein YndB with AHSA1/START domain
MSDNITLQVKKTVKASRQRVFEAWTNSELMKKWFAPGAMVVPSASTDFRVGGLYKVEMKGQMNGQDVNPTVGGTYKKIIPNELISFTWGWAGDPSPETLVTVSLKDVDGGTEVTITHERFASIEARDKHQHGWTGCLENLAKFLSR